MLLEFYGSSDDNFCYDIDEKYGDEVGCFDSFGIYRIEIPNENPFLVVGRYSPKGTKSGCWMIGLCQVDEDINIPEDLDMSYYMADNGYSLMLAIGDLPDETKIIPM